MMALPRSWWFPPLEGLRAGGEATYARYDLDDQPEVEAADDELRWLDDAAEAMWPISDGDPVTPLTSESLETLARGIPLPKALREFAARPELQRRVSSVTGCYLDLGDQLAPTSAPEGYLLHILSDQQWALHWLLYADRAGNETMVVTGEPIGFLLDEGWEEDRPPPVIPLDGTLELEVCADSFVEFLFRFWIENELWIALDTGRPLDPQLASYAQRLPSVS
jgi:hypothetical protein